MASNQNIEQGQNIKQREITEEMQQAYLEYAMSVIVSRALPDVRDGLKPVHRRILHTMNQLGLHPGAKFVKSARIVGECFVKDTLVSTSNGLVAIQDIKVSDEVFTQTGLQEVSALYEMPPQKLLKITTANGISNIVTPSQKFKVFNDKFEFQWKRALELDKGDFIVSRVVYPEFLNPVKLKEYKGKKMNLDSDLAYLVGHFLADGWYEKNHLRGHGRIGFVSCDRAVIQNIHRILKLKFKYHANIEEKKGLEKKLKTLYKIRINRYEINDYLVQEFNLKDCDAYTKSIPDPVLRSPRDVIYSFLSGFIDGDGTVRVKNNHGVIVFSTISPRMADQITVILHHLGVFASKYKLKKKNHVFFGKEIKTNYPGFNIEIYGQPAVLLASRVKLLSPHKAKHALQIIAIQKDRTWTSKFDIVPFAARHLFAELSRFHIGSGWYQDTGGQKFRMGVKYPNGTKIRYSKDLYSLPVRKELIERLGIRKKLKLIGSPVSRKVEELFEHSIQFMEVKSVRWVSAQKTYDIQVEGEHEFIANGMIGHNCMGKYHPHGDTAIYDSLVRMAQDFSLRYPLINGQGNFGSIDGDSASAMRYSEAKLMPITEELLTDIDKDTVDFRDNYDSTQSEPVVLPTKVPNLLINGSMGIAVGMATNIPPHNLTEVLDALMFLTDRPDAEVAELMNFVKGPDFPTGGVIYNETDIRNAYATGRGPLIIRGKAEIVEGKKGFQIIVSEVPYQTNKAELIKHIADLVKDKKLDGIKDVRDESDKDGLRIAIDLKQDAFPKKVLNQLFKYTELQKSFHFNMLALVDGIQPQILGLKGLLEKFIDHRKEVVIRRAKYDLQKAKDRAHILEGLKKALDHIDEIIKIIRASDSKEDAFKNLIKKFRFSDKQATAILEMKLQALAGLERKKINNELKEKKELIAHLETLLASPKKILGVVKDELKLIKEKHGDERRTKVVKSALKEIGEDELVPEEDSLFMLTRGGYIKRIAPDILKAQKRGGKGLMGMATKEEDIVSQFFVANTHDNLLFFTNSGKVFQTKAYEVPESSRQSKGKAIVNFLNISQSETITAVVPIPKDRKGNMFLFMATTQGVIKKVDLGSFDAVRKSGMLAIKLKAGDELGWVLPTSGDDQIMLVTSSGSAIRFKEKDVRPMGRGAAGVIGIRLSAAEVDSALSRGDGENRDKRETENASMGRQFRHGNVRVVGADVVPSGAEKGLRVLAVMKNGYGKRTDLKSYKVQKRGGRGIMTAKITPKTGELISAHITSEENKEIIAVSRKGVVIKTSIGSISVIGRATQGVRVMKIGSGDGLALVVVV